MPGATSWNSRETSPVRLAHVSRAIFATLLLALFANLSALLLIRDAERAVGVAHLLRETTRKYVDQLVQENGLLAQLVQSYTTTADIRYLSYYYAILAPAATQIPPPMATPNSAT